MKLKLTMEMDNAAFEDAPASEAARILRRVAEKIEMHGQTHGRLLDSNGNAVGTFKITGKPKD